MRKKFNEQIDYGDRPERMDPNLERKLGSPENLYASNPALKGGIEDVQKLVSKRFQKVAQKLSQVTGIEDLSSKQVQQMIYSEMMRKLPNIMSIEGRHRDELIQLAIDASLDETETPEGWYQIEANLGMPNASNFRFNPEDEDEDENDEEEEEEENEQPGIPSFDIEDLTDEEILELEKHKRNIINAIIQGAAKKGHYIFQKPEIKSRLDAIDPSLYQDYLGIMAINDFMYFSMEQMIEMMSQTGQGVAGKVELGDADEDEDGEGGEDQPDTKIMATGLIFPILCHEIIKGLEEAKGRHGYPKDPKLANKVLSQTDTLSNEPMQLRIGPEIVERIRFALPNEIFDPSNKGLINWFHILLYQIEAQEFLEVIGNAISEDKSKVKLATNRFKEIVKEAMVMKQEFEDYKEEQGVNSDSDGNDDDDGMLDDFLSDLGIPRAPRN
jgi:hypothetical protein